MLRTNYFLNRRSQKGIHGMPARLILLTAVALFSIPPACPYSQPAFSVGAAHTVTQVETGGFGLPGR